MVIAFAIIFDKMREKEIWKSKVEVNFKKKKFLCNVFVFYQTLFCLKMFIESLPKGYLWI